MDLGGETISQSMSELRNVLFKDFEEESWWFGNVASYAKPRYRLSRSTRTESEKTILTDDLHADIIPACWSTMSMKV